MPKTRKILFDNKWLRTVLLDGWFVASEPAQSKNNTAVAVLPYRIKREKSMKLCVTKDNYNYKHEFLSRFECNPAHVIDLLHQVSIITGACETNNPLYHAKMELLEEGGYDIPEDRFKFVGIVNPMKASCTKLHLYTVRILGKDKHIIPKGDGSKYEQKEYASWVSRDTMIAAKDPYIQTIILRENL